MFQSQSPPTTLTSRDIRRQEQQQEYHHQQQSNPVNDHSATALLTEQPPPQQQLPDIYIPDKVKPQSQQTPQHPSPFSNAMRTNGAKNPFGRPPQHGGLNWDPNQPIPQEPNTSLPPNPYDKSGPPGLSTNFVDINCSCVKHIRSSKCDLPFQSFASCHNAVLTATMKRNLPPMFFQCEGQYARMMMCIQSSGLATKLIEDPTTDKVFVRGL